MVPAESNEDRGTAQEARPAGEVEFHTPSVPERVEFAVRRRLRHTPARELVNRIRHRGIGEKDVILAAFPKSGSTWLAFMVAQAATGEPADFRAVNDLIPPVEVHRNGPPLLGTGGRIIRTHESYRREYGRSVLLVRDPRDVLVSFYFHQRRRGEFLGSIHEFASQFARGSVAAYGSWQEHTRSWLGARDSGSDVLVLRYEDLRSAPADGLRTVLAYLDVPVEPDQVDEIVAANSLSRMREAEDQNRREGFRVLRGGSGVVREGSVGGWADRLRPEDVAWLEHEDGLMNELGYRV
jgi:hypothetical protein